MTLQITVLGLNQVGTSIGLALAEPKGQFLRVSNDRDPEVGHTAGKLGAPNKRSRPCPPPAISLPDWLE